MTSGLAPEEVIAQLRAIEEQLRDLAYSRLHDAVEAGESRISPEQRKLEQARRAVEKAVRLLEGRSGD